MASLKRSAEDELERPIEASKAARLDAPSERVLLCILMRAYEGMSGAEFYMGKGFTDHGWDVINAELDMAKVKSQAYFQGLELLPLGQHANGLDYACDPVLFLQGTVDLVAPVKEIMKKQYAATISPALRALPASDRGTWRIAECADLGADRIELGGPCDRVYTVFSADY